MIVKVVLNVIQGKLLPKNETVEVGIDSVAIRADKGEKLGYSSLFLSFDRDLLRIHKLQIWLHVFTRLVETEENLGLDEVLFSQGFIDILAKGVLL